MKILSAIGDYFVKNWVRFLASFIYGVLIMVAYNAIRKDFSLMVFYSNGAFIAGATLILFGLLIVVNYNGGLDIFAFAFNRRRIEGRKENYYEFAERKKVDRRKSKFSFLSYMIIGLVFILVSLILIL